MMRPRAAPAPAPAPALPLPLALALALALALSARAQQSPATLAPGLGTPIRYPSYAQVVARMRALAERAPRFVRMWSAQARFGVPSPAGRCPEPGGDAQAPCLHW